ncbi:MAG: UDP-N-acetylmuramoyl-L-alanyl-D-glutamate--2,6-diaminopimelate ligase [Sedimentisphaerales bacterium]|nr:UDP-N-acetylmuramoyl-L-alanyl-D-glutamate--2,6-diaminopimelate ligase [Sedimentisphaerales bacterium]
MVLDELIKLISSNKAMRVRIDSRLVEAGDVFIAVEGTSLDGHAFIGQAVKNGAKYIVCQKPCSCEGAEAILVDDSAAAAAALAQASMDNPAAKLINLAVTGTNGKTTIAFLVCSCIQNVGQKCGLIGTIIYDTGAETFEAPLTTPDCLTIAEKQSQMLKAGAKYMVIEASSHALAQNRLAAVDFKAAAFINLTGDHLDYHKTKEQYLAAKTKLFSALSPQAIAVLNKQSPEAEKIAGKTKANILWYAVDEPAALAARVDSMDINQTVFTLEYAGSSAVVKTPLLGLHNVSNHLAAAGLCLAAGFDLKTVAEGLSLLKTVPGRLEKLDWQGDFAVIVDYAHTDDALKNVLTTLKPLCNGKLIVVFGCGGDRDRTKRPRMAKVVELLADFIIVTSDNPRTEKPQNIIGDIVVGFENPCSPKIKIEQDRKKAVAMAIKTAQKDDIILIAGKGHENYQIIGKQKFDFSDKIVALECLADRK